MNDNLITILNNRKLLKATVLTLIASGQYVTTSKVIIDMIAEIDSLKVQADYKKQVRIDTKRALGLKW